jgi:outer membrane receptor for ferrienterochelin and colicins
MEAAHARLPGVVPLSDVVLQSVEFRRMTDCPKFPRLVILLILSAWCWGSLSAEDRGCSLYGTVRDQDGLPIPGAIVLIEQGQHSATTDDTGIYSFQGLPEGSIVLTAATDLFAASSFRVELRGGEAFQQDFVLKPTFQENVLVTGERYQRKRLDEVPVRIEVVRQDVLEKTAPRNLADALDFAPGVRVETNCQNCNFAQVRLLGLDGAYSQILIEGQPVISSLAQVYGIEHIPARMIERIEVIKGGGSAIYGAGSVAGAINVIPREPLQTGGSFESRVEWMDGRPSQSHGGVVDFLSDSGGTSFTAFGQADQVRPLDIDGDGFTEVGRRRFRAAGFRINQTLLEERGRLTFDVGRIEERRRGGNRLDQPEYMADIAESVNSRRTSTSASWRHFLMPRLDYRLTTSVIHTDRDTYYGSGMDPNAYGDTANPLYVVDSQWNYYASRHILSWGAIHSSDRLRDSQPGYDRLTDDTYRNTGFFLQDIWSFAPGWEVLYGGRLDNHNRVEGSKASPRLALKWSPAPKLNLRTSMARGFRPPQVFDEDLHVTQVGGEGAVIRNARDLRHETATCYMTGLEWTPNTLSRSALIEVNFFYTRLKDLFKVIEDDDPATADFEFSRVNLGKAKVYGIELNLGYALGERFRIEGGFVRQTGLYGEPEPDFLSRHFFRTPNTHATASLIWSRPQWFDLFFGTRYYGAMRVPHYAGFISESRLETTSPFTTLDASISRSFPLAGSDSRFILTLGGKNLTNAFQGDLDQGPFRDAGYVYGPRFPRTLYTSLKVGF